MLKHQTLLGEDSSPDQQVESFQKTAADIRSDFSLNH